MTVLYISIVNPTGIKISSIQRTSLSAECIVDLAQPILPQLVVIPISIDRASLNREANTKTFLIGHQCFLDGKCICSSQNCKSNSEFCGHDGNNGCTDIYGNYWPWSCCRSGVCYCTKTCNGSNTCVDDSSCHGGSDGNDPTTIPIVVGIIVLSILSIIAFSVCCCWYYKIRHRMGNDRIPNGLIDSSRMYNPQPVLFVVSDCPVVQPPIPSAPSYPADAYQEQLPTYNQAVNSAFAYT